MLVATTNQRGNFSLDCAPSGQQFVFAWHPEYPPGWISVTPQRDESVKIVLPEGGTLRGTITRNGRPSRSILNLRYPSPRIVGLYARCSPNGTYKATRLAPGLAHVSISIPGTQLRVDKTVTIEEGETTILDVDLASPEEGDSYTDAEE